MASVTLANGRHGRIKRRSFAEVFTAFIRPEAALFPRDLERRWQTESRPDAQQLPPYMNRRDYGSGILKPCMIAFKPR